MTTASTSPLLTDVQAAEILGITRETLEKWRYSKRHNLPYIKIGHRIVRYRLCALEKFLDQRTVKPVAAA